MSNSYVFGFIGGDSYDLLLYLGRVLNELDSNVLLIDRSNNKALSLVFPSRLEDGEVSYKYNIAIGCMIEPTEDVISQYDYVFINFGDNHKDEFIASCDELYLVTDYKLHNILALKDVTVSDEQCRFLIMRDKLGSKITAQYALEELADLNIGEDNLFTLEDSYADLETQLFCQYNSEFTFAGVSESIRSFIVAILCNEFTSKEITAAFKKASRRK